MQPIQLITYVSSLSPTPGVQEATPKAIRRSNRTQSTRMPRHRHGWISEWREEEEVESEGEGMRVRGGDDREADDREGMVAKVTVQLLPPSSHPPHSSTHAPPHTHRRLSRWSPAKSTSSKDSGIVRLEREVCVWEVSRRRRRE